MVVSYACTTYLVIRVSMDMVSTRFRVFQLMAGQFVRTPRARKNLDYRAASLVALRSSVYNTRLVLGQSKDF
jgi:hypothetical protein